MLEIEIPEREVYDERLNRFFIVNAVKLKLEHSLLSLSKWEEKWHMPYFGRAGEPAQHSDEQIKDYIKCMCITRGLTDEFFDTLDQSVIDQIAKYISDPHTATTFSNPVNNIASPNRQTVTAELIYYWMLKAQIPFECEKWNLSKLLTLIRVCEVMDSRHAPKTNKKRPSKASLAAARREMNAARRNQLNTSG